MRILWTVNTIPPELAHELGIRSTHSISWVEAMSKEIKNMDNVKLGIATTGDRNTYKLIRKEIDGIMYYVLPVGFSKENSWCEIISDFHPDVIHAYGTEGEHNISLINRYRDEVPIIISLQGIVSGYLRYYYAGMSIFDIIKSITLGDLLLKRSIFSGKNKFKRQIPNEKYMLQNVRYVEGRSDWDKVFSMTINRDLQYFECPRMIRSPFFAYTWDYNHVEPYSILVHQAHYPIKGMHVMIDALAIIKQVCPNVKMYIAGNMRFKPKTIKQQLLFSGYNKHLYSKIRRLGLEQNIECTGYLSADAMAKKLSSVNVCVIPSAIENAPNSLAEAMIVGTPCVASYAGGSPEMLNNGECGLLYRYEEPEMLAMRICTYFGNPELAKAKSLKSIEVSRNRHNPVFLVNRLMEIYKTVTEDFANNHGDDKK